MAPSAIADNGARVIISHQYKFIFIKTKKTAGTSIEVLLSPLCGADDVFTSIWPRVASHRPRHDKGYFNPVPGLIHGSIADRASTLAALISGKTFYNHMPARIVQQRVPARIWRSYFKFCVERNPWDKVVSDYFYQLAEKGGAGRFDEYLARGRFPLNFPIYCAPEGGVLVDRVLRYEHLDRELAEVFGQLGVPFDGALTIRAKSGYRTDRRPYQEFYAADQRQLVARAFKKELDLHGYQFA